jgi:2-desacetyl-2-hydroxyethyl bacteriochlorophyllide A dehydrogenase
MQAVLFNGPGKLDIIDFNPGEPGSNELLVKVGACGVCGTDFHIYKGENPASIPVIIGHEFTGEVIKTGSGVKNFIKGDRVAIDPNIPCYECDYCRSGKINLCRNLKALGVTINGGFASYSIVPSTQAYLLPPGFPFEIAAFAEPLSCCIHGINQAAIKLNDTVAIVGAGTIGLLMLQLAKLNGAGEVIVYEKIDARKEVVLSLGADLFINPSGKDPGKMALADVVIECVGTAETGELALQVTKDGGRLVIFGKASPEDFIKLHLQDFFLRELTITASLLNPFTFKTAVDLLVSEKIKTDLISIGKINLSRPMINKLFKEPRDGSVIKYMIVPDFAN